MKKKLKIDRAIYLIDDKRKTYSFYKRNLKWRNFNPKENERNKRHISGYKRIFRNGKTKTPREFCGVFSFQISSVRIFVVFV